MTPSSFQWDQENLGEFHVYPGHPIVLACMIMDRYPSLAAALKIEKPGSESHWPRALGDGFIPGAGDAVYAGLETLKRGLSDGIPAAYAHAAYYWDCWEQQSPEHNKKNAEQGRAQCEKIAQAFEARLRAWGTEQETLTEYRLPLEA